MKGNSKEAIKFLKLYKPDGPWTLGAIAPTRKNVEFKTFIDEEKALAFIERENGERNLYFVLNETTVNLDTKPMKADMSKASWFYVDIDTDSVEKDQVEEDLANMLERLTTKLPKGIPEPTAIIYSGNGYWGLWKLNEAISIEGTEANWIEYEAYNKRLEQVFGGDHCHNVDRIGRLPGTINIPTPKKLKKGRVEVVATLLKFEKKIIHSISDFKKVAGVQSSTSMMDGSYGKDDLEIAGEVERITDVSELDEWSVPDRVKVILVQGFHPDQPKEKDNSRSAWLFDAVCSLARCGVPDSVIYSIMTDPSFGISHSVLELKSGADRYARRQIMRAKQYSIDPALLEMNDRHAVIGNMGGKCVVIEEVSDYLKLHNGTSFKRTKLTTSSFGEIKNRYLNRRVQIGVDKDGKPITVPLGKYWLENPKRRQFDTIRFMPMVEREGVYNLWRGFAYEAIPGECDLFLNHIRDNICSGNESHYIYLINWMARVIQEPATTGEVAVVLRGGKGTGKGWFARTLGKLFGRHFIHIANAKHLIGNFNAHLQDCVLLFADEAFFAGDKSHESVLKMLITEDILPIEKKGYDVEASPNFVHLIMAANDPHVIRATGDERRYFVLNMNEKHKQDSEYFGRMSDQLEKGGYEALLYYLQSVDISDFQVRNVPQTDALNEQKLLSMGYDEEWWYQKLQDGRIITDSHKWERFVLTEEVSKNFIDYANTWNYNRRGNETALGKFLNRVVPHLKKIRRKVVIEKQGYDGRPERVAPRLNHYDFGSLQQCRDAWVKLHGSTSWEDPVQMDMDQPEDNGF